MYIINNTIRVKKKAIHILFSFVPSLWKMRFFFYRNYKVADKLILNMMLLGFQFRVIIYGERKRVNIQ